jgi:hypothetical protein
MADYGVSCMNVVIPTPLNATWLEFLTVWWKNAESNHIYLWFLVDGMVHFGCVFVRMPVLYKISAQLDIIDRAAPHQDPFFQDDGDNADTFEAQDIVTVVKRLVEFFVATGFTTLQQLDAVLSSYAVFLANFSVIFDVCWITYGTFLMWNTPWNMCNNVGLLFLRFRSTIFLTLFVFYVLQLGVFLVGQLLQSEKFSMKVVRLGDSIDEGLQLGLPVAKVLLHALVIRHSSDMIAIQLSMHKNEREKLRQRQKAKMKQLDEVTSAIESTSKSVEHLEHDFRSSQREFKSAAILQDEFETTTKKIEEKAQKFAQEVGERSVIATRNAQQLVEEWENGDGPESLQALARGEGLIAAAEILMQDDVTTVDLDDKAKDANDRASATALSQSVIGSEAVSSVFAQTSALTDLTGETASLVADQICHGLDQAENVVSNSGIVESLEAASSDTRAGDVIRDIEAPRRRSQPDEGAGV